MARVKLFVAWSLDGYIARSDGGVDWLFDDQEYGMKDFMASVGTVVMGRKTYEVMENFGQNVYEGKRIVVFSRSRRRGADPRVEWISKDAADFVEDLRNQADGNIWVVGGGDLFMHLLHHEQIDDIMLAIHPVILGDGIKLFPRAAATVKLNLVSVDTYSSGLLLVHYEVQK